jgi:hypothetical protein
MVSRSIIGPHLKAVGPGKNCGKYGTLDAAPRYSEEQKAQILKAYFERPSMHPNGMVKQVLPERSA